MISFINNGFSGDEGGGNYKTNLDINDISDTPDKLSSDMFRLATSGDILINKVVALFTLE